ncbi:dormancy-associated protein homolog 3-like [Miscanthus floridulus]|uniref:dormancy-associated protein homolog 3-like n=1 Tax=Miscanthus floridulus TaxID=154761 RepID=UPI0034574692
MGLLDQLWDETVAGPRPDSGLGRLRKYSFSPSSSSSSSSSFRAPAPAAAADASAPEPAAPAVTRSITIARPPSLSVDASLRAESYSSSVPSSPASTPDSPFATATTPKADGWRRFRRKTKVSDGPEPAVGPRSPTVYDWVVISSLDR